MSAYINIIQEYKDIPGGLIEAYHALQREYNYIPRRDRAKTTNPASSRIIPKVIKILARPSICI
jgi:hypothetical protein